MPAQPPESIPAALRPPSLWVQLTGLLFIELTNWRWSWRAMLVTGTLAPVLSTLALGIFARDSGPQALAYVLTGNLVVSLMFGNMGAIESHVSYMRFRGSLEYFATLPVRRAMLILAMLAAFLLLSLPALAATLLVGNWFLKVPLHPHPLTLLVIPLCALPLSGIGALIGAAARTPEESSAIRLVITLLLAGMGPVLIPPEKLAPALIWLGRFSPATYAASALRQALLGPLTGRFWLDLGMLALISAVIFWVVGTKLDWRQEV